MNKIDQTPAKNRATIRTVAADAGVSVAAVSKVLRNAYGVSDSLRQKVTESIDRLGYRPLIAARGMRGQTYTIGVLLVEIANPFLPEVMAGVNEVCAAGGFTVLMGMGQAEMPIEASLIETMIDHRMDGLIMVAPQMSGQTLEKYAGQMPIVVIGHHEPTARSFDTVNSDDFAGAAKAVEALVAAGHQDIAMLSLEVDTGREENVAFWREKGYLAAMEAAGLADRCRISHLNLHSPDRLLKMAAFLSGADRPRAVFCWSDIDALVLVNQARAAGLRVPEDIAIIGYDNSPVAGLAMIGLTSVDQDGRKLGALAAQTLMSRISGRTGPLHLLVEPSIVMRSST